MQVNVSKAVVDQLWQDLGRLMSRISRSHEQGLVKTKSYWLPKLNTAGNDSGGFSHAYIISLASPVTLRTSDERKKTNTKS